MVRNAAVAIGLAGYLVGCGGEPAPSEAGLVCTPGIGVEALTQGAIVQTGGPMDAAIEGPGFFASDAGGGREVYTRLGRLGLRDGRLDALVFPLDEFGAPVGSPQHAPEAELWLQPEPTTYLVFEGNLSPDAPLGEVVGTTGEVLDFSSARRTVWFTFRRTAADLWEWEAHGASLGEGTLRFDAGGRIVEQGSPWSSTPASGSAWAQRIGFGFSQVTQRPGPAYLAVVGGDGSPAGFAESAEVDARGDVTVRYSNGRAVTLGRLAIAVFEHPERLERSSSWSYVAIGTCAGARTFVTAGEPGGPVLVPGALEELRGTP